MSELRMAQAAALALARELETASKAAVEAAGGRGMDPRAGAAAPAGFDFGDALSAKLNKWVRPPPPAVRARCSGLH